MNEKNDLVLVLGGDTGVIEPFSSKAKANPKYTSFLAILEEADVVFANLECALTDYDYPEQFGGPTANKCDPSVAEDFSSIGVDIFSMSHRVLDFGNTGFFDTMKALKTAGIKYVGGGKTIDEAMQEQIMQVNGQGVGFLSFDTVFSATTQAKAVPSADLKTHLNKPGLAPIHVKIFYRIDPSRMVMSSQSREQALSSILVERSIDEETLNSAIEKVKQAKSTVDYLVVMLHWGTSRDEILDYQTRLGHAIIDAGADVICGTHPHRPHGAEIYKGKPILYSLGNFVYHRTGSAPYLGPEQTLGRVTLRDGKVARAEIIPTLNDNTCVSIADLKLRDRTLEFLRKFNEKNKCGTEYCISGEEIPIEITI